MSACVHRKNMPPGGQGARGMLDDHAMLRFARECQPAVATRRDDALRCERAWGTVVLRPTQYDRTDAVTTPEEVWRRTPVVLRQWEEDAAPNPAVVGEMRSSERGGHVREDVALPYQTGSKLVQER